MAKVDEGGSDSESLCISCGICCDGTLFNRVGIRNEADVESLQGTPVTIRTTDDEQWFSQPCVAFDGCCSIYEQRPTTCRKFACSLLHRHGAGEVSTEEAKRVIRQTIELRDKAVAAMRPLLPHTDMSFHEMQARTSHARVAAGETPPEQIQMLLDIGATKRLISKHFAPKPPKVEPAA